MYKTMLVLLLSLRSASSDVEGRTPKRWFRETDQALSTSRFHCASIDHRYNTCRVDTNDGRIVSARVTRQVSSSRCEEGRSWGLVRTSSGSMTGVAPTSRFASDSRSVRSSSARASTTTTGAATAGSIASEASGSFADSRTATATRGDLRLLRRQHLGR